MGSKHKSWSNHARKKETYRTATEQRWITSKGQVTIPKSMRKRYNIAPHTRLEFTAWPEGIVVRPVRDEGSLEALAGSASKHWTVEQMLRRLDELRREHA